MLLTVLLYSLDATTPTVPPAPWTLLEVAAAMEPMARPVSLHGVFWATPGERLPPGTPGHGTCCHQSFSCRPQVVALLY